MYMQFICDTPIWHKSDLISLTSKLQTFSSVFCCVPLDYEWGVVKCRYAEFLQRPNFWNLNVTNGFLVVVWLSRRCISTTPSLGQVSLPHIQKNSGSNLPVSEYVGKRTYNYNWLDWFKIGNCRLAKRRFSFDWTSALKPRAIRDLYLTAIPLPDSDLISELFF